VAVSCGVHYRPRPTFSTHETPTIIVDLAESLKGPMAL
jgi:hypothetical protein